MTSLNKLNWTAILFWGCIIGISGFALIWQRENIISWIQKPQLPDFSQITQNLTLDKVITFFQKYGTIITVGVTAATTVYGFYMKHKASVANLAQIDAEKETTRIELEANSKINEAQTQALDYKNQYETLLNDKDDHLLQEAQQAVTQQATKINSMQYTIDDLHKENERLSKKLQENAEKIIVVK
jgi:hypothetical protein